MITKEIQFQNHKCIIYYYDQQAKDAIDTFVKHQALFCNIIPTLKSTQAECESLFESSKNDISKEITKITEDHKSVYDGINYNFNQIFYSAYNFGYTQHIEYLRIEYLINE